MCRFVACRAAFLALRLTPARAPVTQMVLASETTGVYLRAVRSEVVLAYMTYLVRKPEEYQLRLRDGRMLPGRGLLYPTVKQALWSIAETHKAMSLPDPTKTHAITTWLHELSRKHVAHGAPAYDIVEARRARELRAELRAAALCLVGVLLRVPRSRTRADARCRTARAGAAGDTCGHFPGVVRGAPEPVQVRFAPCADLDHVVAPTRVVWARQLDDAVLPARGADRDAQHQRAHGRRRRARVAYAAPRPVEGQRGQAA